MRNAGCWALGVVFASSIILIGCEARAISFDSFAPGGLPPGWKAAPVENGEAARWAIIRDGSAPSKPNVLAQLSRTRHPGLFPLAILETRDIADGSVSVKFKPVEGKEDQAGGVVWRYRDAGNYYLARANALENNVAVFKVQNGKKILLHPRGRPGQNGVGRNVPSRAWSILKVSFRNSRFAVYFNHRELFQVEDSTYKGPGKVGLWTVPDSVTYFDDFRAEARR